MLFPATRPRIIHNLILRQQVHISTTTVVTNVLWLWYLLGFWSSLHSPRLCTSQRALVHVAVSRSILLIVVQYICKMRWGLSYTVRGWQENLTTMSCGGESRKARRLAPRAARDHHTWNGDSRQSVFIHAGLRLRASRVTGDNWIILVKRGFDRSLPVSSFLSLLHRFVCFFYPFPPIMFVRKKRSTPINVWHRSFHTTDTYQGLVIM